MNRTKRKKWDTKTGNLNVQRKRIALNGQLKTRKAAKRWKFRVKISLENNIFPFLSPISNQWFERRKKLKRKTFFFLTFYLKHLILLAFLFVSHFCRCYANIWLLVLRRGFDDKFDFSFISLWIFHSISTTRYRFPKTYFHFFSVDFCKKSFKKANTHKIVRYTIV